MNIKHQTPDEVLAINIGIPAGNTTQGKQYVIKLQ